MHPITSCHLLLTLLLLLLLLPAFCRKPTTG
jgi:hypothetical protein